MKIVKLLLDHGANLEVKGGHFASAFHMAASGGHQVVVRECTRCEGSGEIWSFSGSISRSFGSRQVVAGGRSRREYRGRIF